ncbi:hypothetical protein KZJ38_28415 [Paraburkholderia edwinii]|uniref:Transposase n=1 Tax=Paraburkholderia edwinii TaxID=2861782 RepID=A0ABX8UX28_9BURK|nr:hypothetical protein KZJ38_28415 [Paraburkholderia edwinii]
MAQAANLKSSKNRMPPAQFAGHAGRDDRSMKVRAQALRRHGRLIA